MNSDVISYLIVLWCADVNLNSILDFLCGFNFYSGCSSEDYIKAIINHVIDPFQFLVNIKTSHR